MKVRTKQFALRIIRMYSELPKNDQVAQVLGKQVLRSGTSVGANRSGDVPAQKWMKFYTSTLSKFAAAKGLKLNLSIEVAPEGGISKQKIEETKSALRELGMNEDLTVS